MSSKLFDRVTEALGDPDNIELLMTAAASEDRRQVVRSSQIVTRQMLAAMAERTADPSTVGLMQRDFALVSAADDSGPLRLVPGRFEAVGESIVQALSQYPKQGVRGTGLDDPLATPVAWLLAAAIGRHGPHPADPVTMAHFIEREHRRSIAVTTSTSSPPPPPSHRSVEPVPAAPPAVFARSTGSEEDDDADAAASVPPPEDPEPGWDLGVLSTFGRYMLGVGAALWLVSIMLAPEDFNIVLVDRPPATTEVLSAPGRFLQDLTGTSTTLVGLPDGPWNSSPTIPEVQLPEVQLPEPTIDAPGDVDIVAGVPGGSDIVGGLEGDLGRPNGGTGGSGPRSGTELLDVSFVLADPSGTSGATGVAEIVIDPVENRICHRFELDGIAEPVGRIGIGRSDQQAGVMVDLGQLEPGELVCTQVSSTATEALVAAETDHFVEVGDGAGAQVARGQSTVTTAVAEVDESEVVDGVDPAVVSAGLSIRPGVLTLAGAAPNLAVADLLRGELAVMEGTDVEVIDRVTV
ncbi:MAG: hypothetical protein AAFO29_00465, partial [Actinomycetota bacterium]